MDSEYMISFPQQKCSSFHDVAYWFGDSPNIIFPSLVEHNVVSLKEGSDHTLKFLVTSDPALDSNQSHCLFKQEGSPCKTRVYIDGSQIFLKKVQSSDAGTYTVTAHNVVGEGQASFQLEIKTPPKYCLETDYFEAEASSSPTLTFTVTSDPPLPEDTEHTLSKSDGTKATTRFKVENNCITFRRVRVEDSGVYIISCYSEEKEVGEATLKLEVFSTEVPSATGTGTVVKSEDVNMLMSHLYSCASQWKEIGISLNFQYGELQNISASNPGASACLLLTVLLSEWSQWSATENPTLEKLCDALRSGMVKQRAKADEIYSLRDKLPSQSNS